MRSSHRGATGTCPITRPTGTINGVAYANPLRSIRRDHAAQVRAGDSPLELSKAPGIRKLAGNYRTGLRWNALPRVQVDPCPPYRPLHPTGRRRAARLRLPGSQHLAWLILRAADEDVTAADRVLWDQMQQHDGVRWVQEMAARFIRMVRERQCAALEPWLEECAAARASCRLNFVHRVMTRDGGVRCTLIGTSDVHRSEGRPPD